MRTTSDILKTQNAVNLFLRLFLRSPFIVIGAIIMAFFVDAKTAVVFVVTIPTHIHIYTMNKPEIAKGILENLKDVI